MRDITSTLIAAITGKSSVRMLVKAIIQRSRTFFNELTSDYPYDAGDYAAITDHPWGQCAFYSPSHGKMITFVVDSTSGAIYGMEQGDNTKNSLGVTADEDTKPAAYEYAGGIAYIFYWDGSNLKRSTVNLSTWAVSGTITIAIDHLPDWNVDSGSPHYIGEGQLVFTYLTSKGGIGVGFYNNTRWFHWDGRFLSPNCLSATDWTIYSSAAKFGSSIFVYSTDIDTGEVRGVEYQYGKDIWTDSFIALPADLSRFCVTNAITAGGYIHLAGQFHRTEDLANAKVYSLVLRSRAGRVFSWDRFTMLSPLGYQFHVSLDVGGKKLYASDRNSVGISNASYHFVNSPLGEVTLQPPNDIISLRLSDPTSGQMSIRSYDEALMDNDTVVKGSRCKLYIGYNTSAGTEYVHYGNFIISTRSIGFRSGTRELNIALTDEGTWKTNQIAFPFYAEILSKSTIHDDCDERDRMYPVITSSSQNFDRLYVDFWNNDYWDGDGVVGGAGQFRFRDGTHSGCERSYFESDEGTLDRQRFRTIELNDHPLLDDYPTIGSGGTITMDLYGWERQNLSAKANHTWELFAVTAPEDDQDNKTVTAGSCTSTYQKFPRAYPSTQAGSYPITFEWSSGEGNALTAGHVLLYIGLGIYSSQDGNAEGAPERIEIFGLKFSYNVQDSSAGWDLSNPDPDTYDRKYLQLPNTGLPSVMFTTKPYTAFMFNVAADFIYIPGSVPLTTGTIGWGVVGLAKDGYDFIAARYSKNASTLQIISFREGNETILEGLYFDTHPYNIMMEHRDGILKVYTRSSTAWNLAITHIWDEVANGVMSTSDTGIMHTGIYAAVNPPGFLCPGFSLSDSDGCGIMTGQSDSILDGFPNSGKVTIDESVYSYSSVVRDNGIKYGPYQGRQSENYGSYSEYDQPNCHRITYSGRATEIALFNDDLCGYHVKNLIFHSDNGHQWAPITKSDWTVVHSTGGSPDYLRNRSSHYTASGHGNLIGPPHRVYIVPGLMGLASTGTGSVYRHTFGSLVSVYSTEAIYCKKVVATTVDHDATVKDMIRFLCRTADIDTEFTGDWTQDSLSIGASPTQVATDKELFPGGYDMHFTAPALSASEWIAVYASNLYLGDEESTEAIDIGFRNNSGVFEVYSKPKDTSDPEYIQTSLDPTLSHAMRIIFHGEFCSIYADSRWLATFAYGEDNLQWPQDQVSLYVYASGAKTITDITLTELFDWREAIYIESEMSAQSALGSVIQERPIESSPTVDGGAAFSYKLERDTIRIDNAAAKNMLSSHAAQDTTSNDAGSDAVVYYADIAFAFSEDFAEREGFLTRVLKLSSLDTGAETAARIMLEKAYERQHGHSISMRPDPRIQLGDRIELDYILPGTNRYVAHAIIVENCGISLEEGDYEMSVTGREDNVGIRRSSISAYLGGAT